MDKDIYESLMSFARVFGETIKPLNVKTLDFFGNETISSALKSFTSVIKASSPLSGISPSIQDSLRSITHSYTDLIGSNDFKPLINDGLIDTLANLQIDTMFLLNKSSPTVMINDLCSCFENAKYNEIVDVINESLSNTVMKATDVAFIKTAGITQVLGRELEYPRGFISSLNSLNKSTADAISNNSNLEYDTKENLFITSAGAVDSKELNIICSGKEVLPTSAGEIFTENELINFNTFLSMTPMLGLSSETGQKIYEYLKGLYINGDKSIGFDKDVYFHCRSHKNSVMPFTFDQMLKAPNGLPWAGRFNQVGRSNYYFADTRNGAESEVKKHKTNDDVLQTVKLKPIKEIKLLDLSGTLARGAIFLRYLRFSLSDDVDKMPREYLIPCYVSDCCKALGFDGIKYYGSKEYNNYVAWSDGYFVFAGMCE